MQQQFSENTSKCNSSTVSLLRGIRAKGGERQQNNKNTNKKPFVRPFEDDYGNGSIEKEIPIPIHNMKIEYSEDANKQGNLEVLNINNNIIVPDKKLLKVKYG